MFIDTPVQVDFSVQSITLCVKNTFFYRFMRQVIVCICAFIVGLGNFFRLRNKSFCKVECIIMIFSRIHFDGEISAQKLFNNRGKTPSGQHDSFIFLSSNLFEIFAEPKHSTVHIDLVLLPFLQ